MGARDGDSEFQLGRPIQLSALGKERSPRIKRQTGVIVGREGGNTLRVLMDGSKVPMTLHKSYIEPR